MIRRVTILLLSALLLLPFGAHAETAHISGDMNNDTYVSAADAATVLRAAAGTVTLDNAASVRADVTGSMSVTDADATAILLVAAGRADSFEAIAAAAAGGLLGERHLDRFAYRGPVHFDNGYQSASAGVFVTEVMFEDALCYVADVYIRDITCLRTAFAGGGYLAARDTVPQIAALNGALLAVNGDSSSRRQGPLVRNGEWYCESIDRSIDVCVLTGSGELRTFTVGSLDQNVLLTFHPYQTWLFGPRLLDDAGAAIPRFDVPRELTGSAARTCIGYYEPGHYCIVVADGPDNPASEGLTLTGLARLTEQLGCKAAYNLPGGQSSLMVLDERTVSFVRSSRKVSDIIYIAEPLAEAGA